jgi:GNAT superfamily N-acetyltransferase
MPSSSASSAPTPRLLAGFAGQLRQLQDLLHPLLPSPDDLHDEDEEPKAEAKAEAAGNRWAAPSEGEQEQENENEKEDEEEEEEEGRAADAMIRRLLVHPDHASQQLVRATPSLHYCN